MFNTHPARAHRTQTLRSLIGLLCIALVLLAGGITLLHSHPATGSAADLASDPACSLCTLTHVVASPGAVVQTAIITETVTVHPAESPVEPPTRTFFFSLYVRPPPAQTPLS